MAHSEILAGRYETSFGFNDLIGRGGMGAVYRGLDLKTHQPVAIKLLRPEIASASPWLVERFVREGEALRRLNHPNIVKMLDNIQDGDQHFIVMELVAGGSLHELITRQPNYRMPIDLVMKITVELADALARAHHLKIVHRDIKPANVLIASDGTPRLTDFGIARLADLTGVTTAGEVVGTYSYLSPEGYHGKELDVRADIWSFGVMLFEMLTGDLPFTRQNPNEMMTAILNNPVPDLESLRPDAPVALVDLIYRMLEKNPTLRIGSARLVGAEIEAIMRGVDTDFHPLVFLSTLPAVAPTVSMPTEVIETIELTPRFHNLPQQTTPFIGRENELAEIGERLKNPDCRLLTLVGPGGIGKSRLALEAGQEHIAVYQDGVYFISLMDLVSPELLIPTITDSIGFTFSGTKDPEGQLLEYLRDSEMLLVLDNFENMPEAAELVTDILQAAARIKILVTSRESLNLHGEWLLEIQGMAFPKDRNATSIEQYSAVQLFVQGAGRVLPGYSPSEDDRPYILQICQLVGGMPLAIELASSWVRMLSCREIAHEIAHNLDFLETTMRDIPERHRSMRAVFDYSWKGLTPKEQDIFKKLSVFRGGFHRDAAQHISGATLPALSTLVNKSLLYRTPTGRYEIHTLLRQFAARELDKSPEESKRVGDAHCRYYADFIHRREHTLMSPRQHEAVNELAVEIENVTAALEWAVEWGNIKEINICLRSMFMFYDIRGWFMVGEELLRDVVNQLEAMEPSAERDTVYGRALRYQGMFYQTLGNYGQSRVIFERALERLRPLDEKQEIAYTLGQLGSIFYATGNYVEARRYYEEAIAIYRIIDNTADMATPLMRLGDIATVLGNYEEARRVLQETLALLHQKSETGGKDTVSYRPIALCLANFGDVLVKLGEYEEAQQQFARCRAMAEEIGDQRMLGIALVNLGRIALAMGQYEQAILYCKESQQICERTGYRWAASFAMTHLGAVYAAMGQYEQAMLLYRDSLTICEEINNRWGMTFALIHRGMASLALHQYPNARRDLYEALQVAADIRALPLLLESLIGVARYLAHEGKVERSSELLQLALRHPASEYATKESAQRALDELAARGTALANVPDADLFVVARDLLTRFGA